MARESFADTQKGGGFNPKNNENKFMYLKYKSYDPEHPGFNGNATRMVNVDLVVLEPDGSFSEYNDVWLKGAVILTLFRGDKNGKIEPKELGWETVRKLVKLPARQGNEHGSWALNAPTQEAYDKLFEYVDNRNAKAKEALESGDLPWK